MNWLSRSGRLMEREVQSPSLVLARHAEHVPVNLLGVISELGLGFSDEALPAGISGKLMRDSSSPAGFKLFTNEGDPPRRKRFTMAHEIGHYVLHRDLIGDGVVDNAMYRSSLSDDYERQADKFAGQLLLPAGAVRAAYRTTKSFAALSELFDASVDAIRIRLRELNLAP